MRLEPDQVSISIFEVLCRTSFLVEPKADGPSQYDEPPIHAEREFVAFGSDGGVAQ